MSALPSVLGHILEGVVELNPMTEHYQISSMELDGKVKTIDLHELLAQFQGKEVRLTLASFEALAEIAKMVETQGGGGVYGIQPEQLPTVPFNISRK